MVKTDSSGRVIIKSQGTGYGWGSQAYKVFGVKRQYVKVQGQKYFLDEIERLEDWTYHAGTGRNGEVYITVSVFKI